MSYCLCICSNAVVLHSTEIYMLRAKTRKNSLDLVKICLGGTMFYQDLFHRQNVHNGFEYSESNQRLALWVHIRSMQRMATDDIDILGQVSLEGRNLRSFTRSLSANYSSLFCCYTMLAT
jgi:hypothetical protein